MKTKKQTKQRKQLKEFKVANSDFKKEFEEVISDDLLDEEAMVLCLMEEDE